MLLTSSVTILRLLGIASIKPTVMEAVSGYQIWNEKGNEKREEKSIYNKLHFLFLLPRFSSSLAPIRTLALLALLAFLAFLGFSNMHAP